MNLNQVKIYFYVRPSTVKGKRGCLNVRITINSKQIICAVKSLAMYPEEFDVKTQNPKKKCDLYFECQNFMVGIRQEINRIHNEYEKKKFVFTRSHMEKAVEEVYYKIKHGHSSDEKTYMQVYDEFLADQRSQIGKTLSRGTVDVRTRYKKIIASALSELYIQSAPLCNISEEHVIAVQKSIQNSYSAGTAVRVYAVFSMLFEFAIQKKYIPDNPCKSVGSIKGPNAPDLLWLENEEVKKIINLNLEGEAKKYRDAFVFCCFTGLSIGDYMLLNPKTREDILKKAQSPKDIKPGEIMKYDSGNYLVGTRRKTGTPYRVPILPEADQILKQYGGIDNLPFNLAKVSNMLNLIMFSAEIKKTIRFHTARKTMANYLLNHRKMNPFYVKELMGWKKIEESEPYTVVSLETLSHSLL